MLLVYCNISNHMILCAPQMHVIQTVQCTKLLSKDQFSMVIENPHHQIETYHKYIFDIYFAAGGDRDEGFNLVPTGVFSWAPPKRGFWLGRCELRP